MYLDAKDIKAPDLSDSVYTLGALKIHHVKMVESQNSQSLLKQVNVLSFVDIL